MVGSVPAGDMSPVGSVGCIDSVGGDFVLSPLLSGMSVCESLGEMYASIGYGDDMMTGRESWLNFHS